MSNFKEGFLRAIKSAQTDTSRLGRNRLRDGDKEKRYFPEPEVEPASRPGASSPSTSTERRFLSTLEDWTTRPTEGV